MARSRKTNNPPPQDTSADVNESNLCRDRWYTNAESVFMSCHPNTDNTPFLQIFFSPVLYAETFSQVLEREKNEKAKTEYEQDFYNRFERDFFDKTNHFSPERMSGIRQKVIGILSDYIEKDTFDIKYALDNEAYEIDDHFRLKKFQYPPAYRNGNLIYEHYERHKDFYIGYILHILQIMHRMNLENIKEMGNSIRNIFIAEISCLPDTDGRTEALSLTAYYLYCLILMSINERKFIKTMSKSGHLSGLTDKTDIEVVADRDDYISVIEYYPVNTVERTGALEFLAEKDNIYALQELYFLYQNDTILYNVLGKKRGILKKDPVKAERFFQRLSAKNKGLLMPLFRKDRNGIQKNFPLSVLEDHRSGYEAGRYTAEKPAEEQGGNPLKAMMMDLYEIYCNKTIPFNVELIWFLKNVLDKHKEIQEIEAVRLAVSEVLNSHEWIAEVMKQYDENNVDLLSVLFELDNVGFSENVWIAVCCEYDLAQLEYYFREANKCVSYYNTEYILSHPRIEDLKETAMKWKSLADAIQKAIEQKQ